MVQKLQVVKSACFLKRYLC